MPQCFSCVAENVWQLVFFSIVLVSLLLSSVLCFSAAIYTEEAKHMQMYSKYQLLMTLKL